MTGLTLLASVLLAGVEPEPAWTFPHRRRALIEVDMRGRNRSYSVAAFQLDAAAELAGRGDGGRFEPDSIEVVALDGAGLPRVLDASAAGPDRFALPWRVDGDHGSSSLRLSFVVPDEKTTRYAVYFDSVESGHARPRRYPGLIGDGDLFLQGYGRRELTASAHDCFVDLDADGDLDLVQGGTEPFLRVYVNVGGNRMADRGRLTSGGALLTFPHDEQNRSWLSPAFADWDGDGDPDLFVSFAYGLRADRVVRRYENLAPPGAPQRFEDRGILATEDGRAVTGRVRFVDWDGDGRLEVVSSSEGLLWLHRGLGSARSVAQMRLSSGEHLVANGQPLLLYEPLPDFGDIDGDGDLDLFAGTEDGRVYWFENVGSRARPLLTVGRMLVYHGYMDAKAGVRVADFDADGLLDLAVGRFWRRSRSGEQPQVFGRLYKNVGTPTQPRFEARDADGGCPYTERFQSCDALRQNGVRSADWDADGRQDLLVGDTDGYVWYFRNTTDARAPLFAPGERLRAGGRVLKVEGERQLLSTGGYARIDLADWDADGLPDLFVADGRGWLWLYPGQGAAGAPRLGEGRRVVANGKPIDGTARASVMVRDWDGDGRLDVVLAMVGEREPSEHYDWPHRGADPSLDAGLLFYRNLGTARAPRLAAPRWVRAGRGRQPIELQRPNLGDYVDWDGDGRRDLIACEFENSCRLFRSVAGGTRGEPPRFGAPGRGVVLLQPWTAQMISGADARDWNGDGDLDLLTGQGHGGSGIRFYERDYLDDVRLGTLPIVTILRFESRD